MPHRFFRYILLASFVTATLGSSMGSAQGLSRKNPFGSDATATMFGAFEPSLTTTIATLFISAFWLTIVAHVLGNPLPPRRRKS